MNFPIEIHRLQDFLSINFFWSQFWMIQSFYKKKNFMHEIFLQSWDFFPFFLLFKINVDKSWNKFLIRWLEWLDKTYLTAAGCFLIVNGFHIIESLKARSDNSNHSTYCWDSFHISKREKKKPQDGDQNGKLILWHLSFFYLLKKLLLLKF